MSENQSVLHMNLGLAYSNYAKYSTGSLVTERQNLAIFHHEKAAQVFSFEDYPNRWGDLQINLGSIYYAQSRSSTSNTRENLEKAIVFYTNALNVFTHEKYLEKWIDIQHNLGISYSDRLEGSKAENLEIALEHLERALEARNLKDSPYHFAYTCKALAQVYFERIFGKREENLEVCISYCEKSLEVFTHERYSEERASTQEILASVYKERIYGEKHENLERAIALYHEALKFFTPITHPNLWSGAYFNLGTCYKNLGLINENLGENIEKAISCYQESLKNIDYKLWPFEWGNLQNSLGNAYRHRFQGSSAQNYHQAIKHFKNALKVRTKEIVPNDYIMTLCNLGNAHLEAGQLSQAYNSFREAILTIESMRIQMGSGTETKRKLAYLDSSRK